MRLHRLVAGLLGWFALALQYAVAMGNAAPGAGLGVTVNFFSYFTILSNVMAAAMLTVPVLAPASAVGGFLQRPRVQGAVTLYMAVTGIVYAVVLARLYSFTGWHYLADVLLHYAMPVLTIGFWFFGVERGVLRWRDLLPWLAFPLAYSAYTLLRGPIAGFYPYPFMDAARLGLGPVLVNMAGVMMLFLAVGLVLVALDRRFAKT